MVAFADAGDLADVLGVDAFGGADAERAGKLLARRSAAARRVARQTFDLVVDDVATLRGTWEATLNLPEQPVVSVSSVAIDGTPVTSYELLPHGRLYRSGVRVWSDSKLPAAGSWGGPLAAVEVTYTHGYTEPPGDVVDVVLMSAARAWENPAGVTYEAIDDYRRGFSSSEAPPVFTRYETALLRSYRPTL